MRRPFAPDELATMAGLRLRGWNVNHIARYLRRDLHHVSDACRSMPKGADECEAMHVPPEVLADRDRRLAMQPRDLTALLMGDPVGR